MSTVRTAIDALYRAMIGHDIPALDALLDDDVVYVHSPGFAETKQQFLDGVRDGLYVYERVRPVDETITETADMAMVYTPLDFVGGPKGQDHPPVTLLTSLVWRRSGQGWRLLLRHATRMP